MSSDDTIFTDLSGAPLETVGPGVLLGGRYRIERLIGRGGMGAVFEATHEGLRERVAVKVLQRTEVDEAVMRFVREAQAASKLRSEHVARVTDVGETAKGTRYIVMEYLEGVDLRCELERRGRLPVEEVVDYVLQTCDLLAEAHEKGIIHRDLKPANLFLTRARDGRRLLKVLDFGIAKTPSESGDGRLTSTKAVFGSPAYMSPEQIRNARNADAPSDLWSVGVIAYELLARQLPFDSRSTSAMIASIASDAPVPLRSRRPDVPIGLAEAIHRCLEKSPASRFASATELAQAIVPFARPSSLVGGRLRLLSGAAAAPSVRPEVRQPSAPPAKKWSRGRRKRMLSLAATLSASLVIAFIAASLVFRFAPLSKGMATTRSAATVLEGAPSSNVGARVPPSAESPSAQARSAAPRALPSARRAGDASRGDGKSVDPSPVEGTADVQHN